MAAGSVPSGAVGKHSNVDSNVFIYWDNSNIFYEAQNVAEEVEGEVMDVRRRIRIDFHNLLYLARESRTLVRGVVAGSALWVAMEAEGVRVDRFDRGRASAREQEVPDVLLQYQMLNDSIRETPGTMVLLTGDGAGYVEGKGFRFTLESVKMLGWKVKVLSWVNSCNARLRQWAQQNGSFFALDPFYKGITFIVPSNKEPGASGRLAAPIQLWRKRRFTKPPEEE